MRADWEMKRKFYLYVLLVVIPAADAAALTWTAEAATGFVSYMWINIHPSGMLIHSEPTATKPARLRLAAGNNAWCTLSFASFLYLLLISFDFFVGSSSLLILSATLRCPTGNRSLYTRTIYRLKFLCETINFLLLRIIIIIGWSSKVQTPLLRV